MRNSPSTHSSSASAPATRRHVSSTSIMVIGGEIACSGSCRCRSRSEANEPSGNGVAASERFVRHCAEGVDVAGRTHRIPSDLLGKRIRGAPAKPDRLAPTGRAPSRSRSPRCMRCRPRPTERSRALRRGGRCPCRCAAASAWATLLQDPASSGASGPIHARRLPPRRNRMTRYPPSGSRHSRRGTMCGCSIGVRGCRVSGLPRTD